MSAMRLIYGNEKGMVLPLGLMFLAIIAILGTTAVIVTTTDLKIGSNYRASEQAFYAAEAGIQEALYRLSLFDDNTKEPPSGSKIAVNGLSDNNAHISIDPKNLLGNDNDDDGDTVKDEIDELNSNPSQGVIDYDNRTWQTRIMLKTSDDTDTTTTVYTPTIQPSGNWIEYSSSTDDGTVLTIEYKKDANDIDGDDDTSEIVFYNESLTNPLNVDATDADPAGAPASGQPIVVITSTGKSGGSTRKIQVEATYHPVDIEAESAIMVNLSPTLSGSVLVSGFNYDGSTTSDDEGSSSIDTFNANNVDNHGGPENVDGLPTKTGACTSSCTGYSGGSINYVDTDTLLLDCSSVDPDTCEASDNEEEKDTESEIPYGAKLESSGHKPGVWTTQTVSPSADVFGGNNIEPWKKDSAGAWKSLADLLGITQDQLDAILANANVTESDMDSGSGHLKVAPQGIMYIDNAASEQVLKITAATPGKTDGWGLMYVTGDLQSQKFVFKGLIYVEGDAEITSSFWMMGCMAVRGTTEGDFSAGNATFLYSKDSLERYVNKGMKFVILSWQEVLN